MGFSIMGLAGIIFLLATPFVWPRLMHRLEIVGWSIGTIFAVVGTLSYYTEYLPKWWNPGVSFLISLIILGITGVWGLVSRKFRSLRKENRRLIEQSAKTAEKS